MAIGDTVQAGLMRVDSSPILLAGQAQAQANQAFGNAVGGVVEKFYQKKKDKQEREQRERAYREAGLNAEEAKAASGDKELGNLFINKLNADRNFNLQMLQFKDNEAYNAARIASLADESIGRFADRERKIQEQERLLKEEEENKLADNQFINKIMGSSSVPTGQLNKAGQDELERGSLFIAPTEEARSDFKATLLKDPSTQTKVPMMDLSGNQFIREFSGDSPEVQRRAFNLMQANAPKPMTPLQLQEYKINEAEEKRRQTDFNERNQNPSENLSVGQETIDREFGKDIVEFNPADVRKGLTQLREASARLGGTAKDEDGKAIEPENLTGAMIGIMPDSFNDIFNPKASEVKEAVEEVVQRNLRLVLGAQFTEKEGQRLISRAYNPRLDETENKKRVDRLIKSIEGAMQQKQDQARYFNEKGTLKGYQFVPVSIESIERDAFDGSTTQSSANTIDPADIQSEIERKKQMVKARQMNTQYFDNPNVPNVGNINSGN